MLAFMWQTGESCDVKQMIDGYLLSLYYVAVIDWSTVYLQEDKIDSGAWHLIRKEPGQGECSTRHIYVIHVE